MFNRPRWLTEFGNRCISLHISSVYGRKPSLLLPMDVCCHWKVRLRYIVIIDLAITLKSHCHDNTVGTYIHQGQEETCWVISKNVEMYVDRSNNFWSCTNALNLQTSIQSAEMLVEFSLRTANCDFAFGRFERNDALGAKEIVLGS